MLSSPFCAPQLKLPDGEVITIGAGLLKACQAELYREYVERCENVGDVPLDETNYRRCCANMSTGQMTKQGALDPTGEQTRVNFQRVRGYLDEIAVKYPQFQGRCTELTNLVDLSEKLLKRTVQQVMGTTGSAADVAEFDLSHAFADPVCRAAPRLPAPSRPVLSVVHAACMCALSGHIHRPLGSPFWPPPLADVVAQSATCLFWCFCPSFPFLGADATAPLCAAGGQG